MMFNLQDALHTFMQHMFNPTYKGSGQVHYLTTLQEFAKQDVPRGLTTKLGAIRDVFSTIAEFNVTGALTAVAATEDNFTQRIANGVSALITSINETKNALSGLGRSPLELQAELQRVNNSLNLKGGDRLTIAQQPVTLNVVFNVTMDTKEVETALLSLPNRRISISE
jgi:hypothetical protein